MRSLNVAFRVDASTTIGIGHLMRTLTLADALLQEGSYTRFISRNIPEYMHEKLINKGHAITVLKNNEQNEIQSELKHAHWLGVNQEVDAKQTLQAINDKSWDWMVTDHYAIDYHWHGIIKPYTNKIMVIDDLADRQHECILLMDQTLGRKAEEYRALVPETCDILTGAHYALLRPEFSAMREQSLKRREHPKLEHFLITMGGMDHINATGTVLEILRNCPLPKTASITVIMGAQAPSLNRVIDQARNMPWPTEVKVNVENMAELMNASDLIIGAAGSSTWERCCLGVPGITVVIADNQENIANALQQANASLHAGNPRATSFRDRLTENISQLLDNPAMLKSISDAAAGVTAGTGTATVMQHMQ